MEAETLYALRSPAGLPSHPVIFLVLLVLTWALHILAVHVMLGSTALSLFGSCAAGEKWQRLSESMLNTAKVAVSIAIVLGVAPLLFVQVIYDPFWYVSNVLSARWALGFILILLIAYYAMYHRYFVGPTPAKRGRISLTVSLLLLLVAGFLMHVLTNQMLRPELWLSWYFPNGHIDPSGAGIHEFNPYRFAYFIALSIPVTGAWLAGYSRYLGQSHDIGEQKAYRYWLDTLYARLMRVGGLVALLFYAIWMSTLPDTAKGYMGSFWPTLGALATVALVLCPSLFKPDRGDYRPMVVSALAILAIAIAREALRLTILGRGHGYDLMTYPVNSDSYGFALFLLTFLGLGVPAVAYSIGIAWEAGKSRAVYVASPRVAWLGRISLFALGIWICQYFLFGIITMVRG